MDSIGHTPVLLEPVLAMLKPHPGQACVDCTLGRGGHAAAIIPRLGPGGHYIGLDTDADNAAFAKQRLAPLAEQAEVKLSVHHANFTALGEALNQHQFSGLPGAGADLLLADLGFASNQVDDGSRGLSFHEDAPLDMRLDRTTGQTAADLLAKWPNQAESPSHCS